MKTKHTKSLTVFCAFALTILMLSVNAIAADPVVIKDKNQTSLRNTKSNQIPNQQKKTQEQLRFERKKAIEKGQSTKEIDRALEEINQNLAK